MTFDIQSYQRHGGRLQLDGMDFDDFRDEPLSPAAIQCLQYMHDVEFHTACYLRNLLNTKAHHDPELTGFLAIWNYEELWHGEALAAVLAHHDLPGGTERVASMRRRLGWRLTASPLGWMAMSAAIPHFIAVHMTIGAVNEWTTQAAYSRLATVAGHPTLTALLKRIMRQEGRHIDYYASHAKSELSQSKVARKVTRGLLNTVWQPVGATVMPKSEMASLAQTLFTGPDGQAALDRIDHRVSHLPGMEGLRIAADAVAGYTVPLTAQAPHRPAATGARVPVGV